MGGLHLLLARECAQRVVEVAREEGVTRLLCHSFSNNGGALYQQLVEVVGGEEELEIAGAVFDSAPGPIHLLEAAAALFG